MKKFGSLALAMMLILTVVLAGCASKKTENNSSPTNAAQTTGDKQTASASPTAVQKEGPSWKWDTSPVTLDWYAGILGYTKKWDAENTLTDKLMTQATGVKVNFTVPANDVNSQMNAMIASGNLPDMITLDKFASAAIINTLLENDLVYSFDELADQYAPTMRDVIPESMRKWYTKDGKWFAVASHFAATEDLEKYPEVADQFSLQYGKTVIVRKDLMEQAGIKLEELQHEDTFIAALKKFKDAKIKYNGLDVAPIYFRDKDSAGVMVDIFGGSFGATNETADGHYTNWSEESKHAYQFVNKLNQAGLLTLENFTSDRKQVQEKLTQGSIFMFVGNVADITGEVKSLYTADKNAQFIPVGPVFSSDGKKPQFGNSPLKGWAVTLISKKAKNPDRAVRFLEYLFDEEGQTVNTFGQEGVTFTKNGKYYKQTDEVVNDFNADYNKAVQKWGTGSIWFSANSVFDAAYVDQSAKPEAEKLIDALNYGVKDYVYDDSEMNVGNLVDAIDPGSDEAKADAQITTYMQKQIPKVVLAKSDTEFESEYKKMLETWEKLGGKTVEAAIDKRVQELKSNTGRKVIAPSNGGQYYKK